MVIPHHYLLLSTMIQILKISIGLMVYFILAIEGNGQSSFPILGPANMQLPIFTIK